MNRLGADPRTVFVLGLLAALKAAALVGIAQAVATGIVGAIAGDDVRGSIALGLASGLLRAIITWVSASYATRAAIGAKERLRRELAGRLLMGSDAGAGSAAVVGTVGLDELDNYYRTALPAVITAATVPLLVGVRILFADPISAIIVIITVPLVPVFMALVGMHTRDRADEASASLQRLSDHLVELARGLPVLVGLGRVDEQSVALRAVSERHRVATMSTLRTAFLSSLVLELISTISVAVVAVFVGVRLVQGDLSLEIGLIALVLAPECFAPFRELGSAFHSSQNGLAAMRAAREIIDAPDTGRLSSAVHGAYRNPTANGFAPRYSTSGLTVRYADRTEPAVSDLSFEAPVGSITSLEGESGSGKSTVLGVLAGLVPFEGTVWAPADVAWVPQHPHTVASTVRDEVRLYANSDEAVDDALQSLDLTAVAAADPNRLSPGELRRLAVARGLVRVAAGAQLLLLDEPTAHLDPTNAARVEAAIEGLRGRVTIVVASHEAGVTRLADHRVLLGGQGGARDVEQGVAESASASSTEAVLEQSGAVRELLAFLRPSAWRTVGAILLGAGAALAAISLAAVSGWLIVRASEEPGMMYLMVAIVGVRFFGLARAGLRYSERLLSHSAVLGSVTDLRARLWAGLAARGPASRALATGGSALDYLVAAADRVRDLVPRVVVPPAVAIVTGLASIIAVGLLHAPALPLLLGALAVSALVAPAVALVADRSAARGVDAVRSTSVREFTAMVAASGELRANGISNRMMDRLTALDSSAGRFARSSAWALGLGNAIVVFACTAAAMLMLTVTDGVQPAVIAVLVLLPLALIEAQIALVDAVQQWPALSAALRRVRSVGAPPAASSGVAVGEITHLELRELAAGWTTDFAFTGVNADASTGDWIVVEGPSGSGKSTLLATMLGYLPVASGALFINGADATTLDLAQLRSRIAWCPQEAHLFDSTIRGNLLLARPRDDMPSDVEMEGALVRVGLGPLLSRLTDGLDSHVGSAGDRLSGGERQRLAVARTLLTRSDIVLLDEPTAHLDAAAAEALMRDLRFALRDRIVVLVSHHGSERVEGDVRVRLGSALALR